MKRIADAGIFNLPDCTPIQSAEKANVYEAFQYLAYETAEARAKSKAQ